MTCENREAKLEVINKLLDSLSLRVKNLIKNAEGEEFEGKVLTDCISSLAQATNKVGDLLTRPVE